MDSKPSVIAFGEALWDVFGSELRPGGAPANFAYHVAQHGLSVCAVSAVGQDALGDDLVATLSAAGVPCALQRVPYDTGEVAIELLGDGIPRYAIRPDAAWDHIAPTPELLEMARHARALCFGSLAQRCADSRHALASLLAALPADALRILDVNLRGGFYTTEILQDSLRVADVLKLNDEEMEILGRAEGFAGLPLPEQARGLMARYGLSLLILTCGAIGSYVLGGGGEVLSWLATPGVHVVDTVGAGDSFTATFISALLCGQPIADAHAAAVRVAAWVCTQPGAMVQLPDGLRISQ